MIIGAMVIDFFSDEFHSLKDKRQILQSVKSKLRLQFNIAICESNFQDSWQRAQIALTSISTAKTILETLFLRVEEFIAAHYGLRIDKIDIRYL